MAGVPTGRGCDGCRKQKKKCDLGKPACSRCIRVRIPCVGNGQKRYKFKQENPGDPERTPSQRQPEAAPRPPTSASNAPGESIIRRVPGNELTRGARALIALLDISDLRYSISGFGAFMGELPQRMGRNVALDASIGALTAVFPRLYSREISSEMLVAYVHALKCLRVLLADRVTAQTPDTLCAIYIVMLCQSWIGNPDDKLVGHSEAVVHILNCIAVNRWKGHFENQLFMTLSLSVLPESIYNPAIRPGPWFQRIVDNFSVYKTTSQKNGGPGPAVGVLTLMRLVEFVRDQQGDIGDIQAGYDAMFHQTAQARENLARMFASQGSHWNNPGNPNPMVPGGAEMEKIRLLCQAQYALLLSATMLVNGVLSAIMPSNAEIPKQVAGYPDELVELTRQTAKYKPIGSGFMPTCLLMACATTTDRSHMAKMTGALAEYGTGAMESKWGYWASQMRSQFQDMRFKMSLMRLEGSLV